MKVLLSSANAVWEATIVTCFKNANINSPNQGVAETDADDLSKCLVWELNSLRAVDLNVVEEDISAESFTGLDNDVKSGWIISDTSLIFDTSNVDNNVDDDDNSNYDSDKTPHLNLPNIEVDEALNKFHNISLFSTKGNEI